MSSLTCIWCLLHANVNSIKYLIYIWIVVQCIRWIVQFISSPINKYCKTDQFICLCWKCIFSFFFYKKCCVLAAFCCTWMNTEQINENHINKSCWTNSKSRSILVNPIFQSIFWHFHFFFSFELQGLKIALSGCYGAHHP